MIVLLHNIRSMHNVGSIFRTAEAAGVEKIYLCGITPSPIDELGRSRQKLVKVALGAEKFVKWEKSPTTLSVIKKLKKRRYKIYAIEQGEKSIPYYSAVLSKSDYSKVVLVLGGEIKGLTPPILKECSKVLEIPMHGKKESLNVSVAFGIVIFHLLTSHSGKI